MFLKVKRYLNSAPPSGVDTGFRAAAYKHLALNGVKTRLKPCWADTPASHFRPENLETSETLYQDVKM